MSGHNQAQTFYSALQKIGRGSARSFVTLDRDGNAKSFGISLSRSSLQRLPATPQVYTFNLPKRTKIKSVNHISMDWNPQGHSPDEIYSVPHFDFHFYTISPQQRRQITAEGEDIARVNQMPAPELLPPGYVLLPDSSEPFQGSHWVDANAPEFQAPANGFTQTFIYGFYNGQISFLEPMLAKSVLLQERTFSAAIKPPAQYAKPGVYPTRYRLTYNRNSKEYRLELTGLRQQPRF